MSRLSAAQLAVQRSVREFAETEVRAQVSAMLATQELPRDLYRRCGELGYWRLNVPTAHGGDGKGLTEASIVMEELARVSPALALSVEIGVVALPMLVSTNAARYAEGIMRGDIVVSGASTDPAGQSNTTEWEVLAREDGDSYVLDGTRLFVTNAAACDLLSVSGLDESRQMRKFYVPVREVDGMRIEDSAPKFGMAGNGGGTIVLEGVRIPKEMSAPFAIGNSTYYYYVYCLCAAEALGCMQGAYDITAAWAKERTRGGAPLTELQAVSHKLARLRLSIEMARSLVYDAAATYDALVATGAPDDDFQEWRLKAEAAKVCVSELAVEVTTECVVLHGGRGYHDPLLHHFAGDALCYRIMDLTNEIHLDNVAQMIGLTR